MDVQRWLHEITVQEPPASSGDLRISTSRGSAEKEGNEVRKYRRRYKRAAGGSPSIAPQREGHLHAGFEEPGDLAQSGRRRRRRGDETESSDIGSRFTETASGVGSSSNNDETRRPIERSYERRARHKTKTDRYQPKQARKQKQRRDGGRADKTKNKRHKSRRTGDGQRTEQLIQSFQLRNGREGHRLTASAAS